MIPHDMLARDLVGFPNSTKVGIFFDCNHVLNHSGKFSCLFKSCDKLKTV